MNYILVSSSATQRGPQRVNFSGPTYIDYYTEGTTATLLQAQLYGMFVVSPQITPMQAMPNFPSQGFSYNYTVNVPSLAVLEFLKQHGYQVIGTNTIGDTCIWTLHKQTGTTDQSTPQTTEKSMQRMQRKKR